MYNVFGLQHPMFVCQTSLMKSFTDLCKGLLVLPVLECVDEGVDDGRGPGEDGGQDVQEGELDVLVGDVDQHQGEEADLKIFEIFKDENGISI